MIHSPQRTALRNRLVVALAACQLAVFQLPAEPAAPEAAPQKLFSGPGNISLPPLPHVNSPVDLFRELLAMTPAGRENYLTNRPSGIRNRILAKVREYEALDPNERELRLRATELRWYLLPLLRESPTNRAAQLATIPEDLQPLVKNRLRQWDILPPPLKDEFLESDRTLRYFTHVDPSRGQLPPPDQNRRDGPHGPPRRTGIRFRRSNGKKSPTSSTGFSNSPRRKKIKHSTPFRKPSGSKWKRRWRRLGNCPRRSAQSASRRSRNLPA